MRKGLFRLFVICGVVGLVCVGSCLVARQTWKVHSAPSLTTSDLTRVAYQDIGERVVTLARKKCSPFIVDMPNEQSGDPIDEIEVLWRKLRIVELDKLRRSLKREPESEEVREVLNGTPYYELDRIITFLRQLIERGGNDGPAGTADIALVVWVSLWIGDLIDFGEADLGEQV